MKKVAVTGGLSCGKSSVCRFFKELGAYVVSADEIVHQLLFPDTHLGRSVIDLIGADIVADNKIDRAKIAHKVFNQPELLHSLEQILHPAVRAEVEKYYHRAKQQQASLFIAEIPLLFEIGGEKDFDYTIAVVSDSKTCAARFYQTTGYDKEEYDKRMARQLSPKEKAAKATWVINNGGNLEEMRQQVLELYAFILNKHI